MTVVGSRPAPTCPTWCTADHEAELQRRREMAEDTARSLAADGLFVNPVPDTYRMHTAEVGRVVVRASASEVRGLVETPIRWG